MAKLAPTQIEQLQGIGAYLRQVRQQQGLAVDVLANQIFIRPALLQALESGQGAELPEAVFIQGFIRRYAEALGLDGQAIAQEFQVTPATVPPTADLLMQPDANGAVKPAPAAVQVAEPPEPLPMVRRSSGRREGSSPLPLLLSLGALAVILGLGAWGLWGRNSEPMAPANAPTAPLATDSPAEDESLDPLETEVRQSLEAPIVVSANVSNRAWLSVVADGQNVYEGVAEVGFEETWTAENSLVFTTGNAGGIELSVNGDRSVVVGSNGAVRTLTFTPDSSVETVQSP